MGEKQTWANLLSGQEIKPELPCFKEVEQDQLGRWWFHDEVWYDAYGPFETEAEAKTEFGIYCAFNLEKTNLAIVGSRSFNDYEYFKECLDRFVNRTDLIITGDAKGTDEMAIRFAKENGINYISIVPDRSQYKYKGKSIYYERNVAIWKLATIGIAFWDGKSKGTAHSFKIAEEQGKQLIVFKTE